MVDCCAHEVTTVVAAVLAALFPGGSSFAKLRRGKRTAF
jgi:hypothetical protein